jgi:hypothetical protein
MRLVFVADHIPGELRRVVEFLNEQMERTHVLAIEVKQYLAPDSDLITLVPRLIGQTEAAKEAKRGGGAGPSRSTIRWGEDDLIERIRRDSPGAKGECLINLYEWMRDQPDTRPSWGRGRSEPSVVMWVGERHGEASNPVAIAMFPKSVGPWIYLLRGRRRRDQLVRAGELLRGVPGVDRDLEGMEANEYAVGRPFPSTRCSRPTSSLRRGRPLSPRRPHRRPEPELVRGGTGPLCGLG